MGSDGISVGIVRATGRYPEHVTAPALPERSAADRHAIRIAATIELARRSFPDFLTHVQIRSDDPQRPGLVPFAPWPYQLRLAEAWQAGESEVILKARQIGMSTLVKAYAIWRAWAHGWHIGYWSKGDDESVAWLAGDEAEWGCQQMADALPDWLGVRTKRSGDRLSIGKGGVRVFPGTQSGGISYTFQLIVADEAAHHPYGAQNYANYRPTISGGGQFLCLSTSNPSMGPNGWFYEMYQAAKAGTVPYACVFLGWDSRSDRDAEWRDRERAASAGDSAAFGANYPEVDDDAFQGREGLVYPEFDRKLHVLAEEPLEWEACTYRVVGYDLGGGDPTAFVALGAWPDPHSRGWRIHQYYEWVTGRNVGAPSADNAHAILREWDTDAGLIDFVEGDPKEPTLIASLSAMCRYGHGMDCPQPDRHRWPIKRANWARGEGIDTVRGYLAANALTIGAHCERSIHEFAGYRYPERVDPNSRERFLTTTPYDHHADAMDARRYAVLGLHYAIANSRRYSASQQVSKIVW